MMNKLLNIRGFKVNGYYNFEGVRVIYTLFLLVCFICNVIFTCDACHAKTIFEQSPHDKTRWFQGQRRNDGG